MQREFRCPSCGAANKVTNPGVLMKVCDFCKTALYWDKESALRIGLKSMDLPPSSRFKVGASGKIKGQRFTVLGRLSYAHEKGTWNEWFIEMPGGQIKWLSEDEGELFLETPLKLTAPVPPADQLEPGMQIMLNDKQGVIEEIGEARCLGGEGQIPFEVEVGETYPYADGTAEDGSFIFGIEYDAKTGTPTAFTGKALSVGDSRASAEARDEAVDRLGEMIRCPSCGKPYEGRRLETTKSVVCEACGSALELDEAELKVVGKNVGKRPAFSFEVGMRLMLEKTPYEVMGRLFYVEREGGVEYPSYEYILYDPDKGYLWLSQENGHFTVSRPIHESVKMPAKISAKKAVTVGNVKFSIYEGGTVTLRWVDGALPWTATVGEETRYVHMIKPPQCVDREVTGKEMELFLGRYVDREEMVLACPKGVTLPERRGVYSCQPYHPSPWIKGLGTIGAIFFAMNLLLFFYGLSAEKLKDVMQETIPWARYSQEHLSKPFNIPRDRTILRLEGSAPLKNSWIGVDFGLVDTDDRVLKEFFGEGSYYAGTDSDGAWTEGSRSFTKYFKVDKNGTYKLLVHATGGSGTSGPAGKEPLGITLTAGATMSRYFMYAMVLSALVAVIGPIARAIFEYRRWSPVTGD